MATGGRSGVLVAALARRGFAWAPDWRAFLAGALAREVEERRFFLWIPVAAMAGVALNFAADSEPVLWLPALLTALFAALAWVSRARPLARGLLIGAAALSRRLSVDRPAHRAGRDADARPCPHRQAAGLRRGGRFPPGRRAAGARRRRSRRHAGRPRAAPRPGDDPQGAGGRGGRLRRAAGAAAAAVARRRCRAATTSPATPISPASARSARRSARSASCRRRPTRPGASAFGAAIDHARNRLALRVDAIIGGDEGAIAAAMVTGKRDFLSNDAKDLIREAGIFHIITISGVQMTLVAGIFFVVARRLLALSPTLGAQLSDQEMGGRRGDARLLRLRPRHRLARRHRARADHDADRARRGHARPPRADDAQSRARGAGDRRAGAGGDPRRQLPALVRRGRRRWWR